MDNDGYAIERAIHGPSSPTTTSSWDWEALMTALAPGNPDVITRRAGTVGELADALARSPAVPSG